jgi:ATP-binding cassette, subfamily B, bacterial PglK
MAIHVNRIGSIVENKKGLPLLFLLIIINSLLELLGLGVIAGTITFVLNSDSIPVVNSLFKFKSTLSSLQVNSILGLSVIVAFSLKNISSLWIQKYLLDYLVRTEIDVTNTLLKLYLSAKYDFVVTKNHSEILRNITSICTQYVNSYLRSLLFIVTDSFVAILLVIFLLWYAPIITISLLLLILTVIGTFYYLVKDRLLYYGKDLAETTALRLEWINNTFGSIKERSIMNRNSFFLNGFINVTRRYAEVNAGHTFISRIPRPLIEVVLITSIVAVGIMVAIIDDSEQSNLIATIGVFMGASMRLVPALSVINSNLQMLRLQSPNVDIIYNEFDELSKNNKFIEEDLKDDPEIQFMNSIELNNISFNYIGSSNNVLRKINLKINRGESVAFVGSTGAGKTTIVDLIMGLIEPVKGNILVDGLSINKHISSWQKKIGYVPQSVYLLDSTIKENIAFALDNEVINDERILEVLNMAQLNDMVHNLPDGLDTRVGERGVRLSGGQRQRVNIARALYHNPEIIVFDEATAALDNVTEQEIVNSIDALKHKKTVIVIAHRLSTVYNVDRIYFMKDGEIVNEGTYDELMHGDIDFKKFSEGNPI